MNVAYGWALLGGADPPVVEGLPSDVWHDHSGTVAEEMLNPHGLHGGQHGSAKGAGSRVVMVHVWTTPNPDGPFAQHNWALSFLRAGLTPPEHPTECSSRFVGLGTEVGLAYQLHVVRLLFGGTAADEARAVVVEASNHAHSWIVGARHAGRPDQTDVERLDRSWRDLGLALTHLAPDQRVLETVERLHGI